MTGAAEFAGYWDIELAAPPWAPVSSIATTNLNGGWAFNPDCYWPMPMSGSASPKFGPASAPVAEQIVLYLFDQLKGPADVLVAPASGGGGQGFPNWFDNRAIFLFNDGGPYNSAFKVEPVQQISPNAWVEPPILAGPNNNVKQTPLIWKDDQAITHWGALNGDTGTFQFYVWDADTGTNKPAFNTGGVNIPFWLVDSDPRTVFNWTDSLDVLNRTFVPLTAYHSAELILWSTGLGNSYQTIASPTLDIAVLNNSINGGTGSVAYATAVCPLGFIFVFQTNGTGLTKQRFEVAIIDLDWNWYVLCRFFPTDQQSSQQLVDTQSPTVCLSPDGSFWFNSGQVVNSDQLYPLIGTWKLPQVGNIPSGSWPIFNLPCFQPCTTLP